MTYRKSFLFSADDVLLEKSNHEGEGTMAASAVESLPQQQKPVEVLKKEAESLREELKKEKQRHADTTLLEASQKVQDISILAPLTMMKVRKVLKRHEVKIMQFDWSADNHHVITGGQDGMLCIWDAFTEQKEMSICTDCEWVLTCAYAPSTTKVACGGLNKKCYIYEVKDESNEGVQTLKKVISHHTDYLTKCCFFGADQQLLTGSADTKILNWDLEADRPIQSFLGHRGEVLDICLQQLNPFSVFGSCSSDQTCCLWDARTGQCTIKFDDFKSQVNGIQFLLYPDMLGVACNDGTVHLMDLKAVQEVMVYTNPAIFYGATSLDFSQSGKVMFVGYVDHTVRAWDVLKGKQMSVWYDHHDRVSHVQMSRDRFALGSCSWDGSVRIWA